jgi:hypothetical protein
MIIRYILQGCLQPDIGQKKEQAQIKATRW